MSATYLNLSGRIAYESDPTYGSQLLTWPIYVEFTGQDDPLLVMLLERIRAQLDARIAKSGPGDILLG